MLSPPRWRLGHRRLVSGQIVHDNNVTWFERRNKHLLDISKEHVAVHRAIVDERRGHARQSECAGEGRGLPMMGWTPPDGIGVPKW